MFKSKQGIVLENYRRKKLSKPVFSKVGTKTRRGRLRPRRGAGSKLGDWEALRINCGNCKKRFKLV